MIKREDFQNVTKIKCRVSGEDSWCDMEYNKDTLSGTVPIFKHFPLISEVVAFSNTVKLSVYQVPNINTISHAIYFNKGTHCHTTSVGYLKCYHGKDKEIID